MTTQAEIRAECRRMYGADWWKQDRVARKRAAQRRLEAGAPTPAASAAPAPTLAASAAPAPTPAAPTPACSECHLLQRMFDSAIRCCDEIRNPGMRVLLMCRLRETERNLIQHQVVCATAPATEPAPAPATEPAPAPAPATEPAPAPAPATEPAPAPEPTPEPATEPAPAPAPEPTPAPATEPAPTCAICLEELPRTNTYQTNPCHHKFCRPCIMRWRQQDQRCPICRSTVTGVIPTEHTPIGPWLDETVAAVFGPAAAPAAEPAEWSGDDGWENDDLAPAAAPAPAAPAPAAPAPAAPAAAAPAPAAPAAAPAAAAAPASGRFGREEATRIRADLTAQGWTCTQRASGQWYYRAPGARRNIRSLKKALEYIASHS